MKSISRFSKRQKIVFLKIVLHSIWWRQTFQNWNELARKTCPKLVLSKAFKSCTGRFTAYLFKNKTIQSKLQVPFWLKRPYLCDFFLSFKSNSMHLFMLYLLLLFQPFDCEQPFFTLAFHSSELGVLHTSNLIHLPNLSLFIHSKKLFPKQGIFHSQVILFTSQDSPSLCQIANDFLNNIFGLPLARLLWPDELRNIWPITSWKKHFNCKQALDCITFLWEKHFCGHTYSYAIKVNAF